MSLEPRNALRHRADNVGQGSADQWEVYEQAKRVPNLERYVGELERERAMLRTALRTEHHFHRGELDPEQCEPCSLIEGRGCAYEVRRNMDVGRESA